MFSNFSSSSVSGSTMNLGRGPPKRVGGPRTLDAEDDLEKKQKQFEIIFKYTPMIHPITGMPMWTLNSYDNKTLVDPRACINYYDGRADVCNSLWVHVGEEYFHAMVVCGYIRHLLKVLLHDTKNMTYLYRTVRNIDYSKKHGLDAIRQLMENSDKLDRHIQRGSEILRPGTPDKIGYYFGEVDEVLPKKKSGEGRGASGGHLPKYLRVMDQKDFEKHHKQRLETYEGNRKVFNECKKNDLMARFPGRVPSSRSHDDNKQNLVPPQPTIVIESNRFNLVKATA